MPEYDNTIKHLNNQIKLLIDKVGVLEKKILVLEKNSTLSIVNNHNDTISLSTYINNIVVNDSYLQLVFNLDILHSLKEYINNNRIPLNSDNNKKYKIIYETNEIIEFTLVHSDKILKKFQQKILEEFLLWQKKNHELIIKGFYDIETYTLKIIAYNNKFNRKLYDFIMLY